MLHEAQRTSAPSALSVSISTAVWIVMCSEPQMRAPRSGWVGPYSSRVAIRPGISVSAMAISLRPHSAKSDVLDDVVGGGLGVGGALHGFRRGFHDDPWLARHAEMPGGTPFGRAYSRAAQLPQ